MDVLGWLTVRRQIIAAHKAGKSNSAIARELQRDRGNVARIVTEWKAAGSPEDWPAVAGAEPVHEMRTEADSAAILEFQLPANVQRLKRENDRLKKDNAELLKQHEEDEKLFQMFGFIKEAKMDIPEWTRKTPSRGNKRQAIPTALFSDWHFDEVVNPAQINYVNE